MVTLLENVAQVNSDFQAIKNKIVEKGVEVEEGTRTSDYAAKVEQVYEAGKQAEYDAFWDKYQLNGTRNNYQYGGFGGYGWDDNTYKPKYPVKVKYPYAMFMGCRMTEIKDVDFSSATDLNQTFYVCESLEHIGTINAPLATTTTNAFNGCKKLHTIDKLIISENMNFHALMFNNCLALENIVIEGTIGTSVDLQWSTKLTKQSILSILNALKNRVSGMTLTLSLEAVDREFWDYDSLDVVPGSMSGVWNTLARKAKDKGWTISLV